MRSARLVQFITAGIDFVKLDEIPDRRSGRGQRRSLCGTDGGARLAMTLAAAKRLLIEHAALARGEFNQQARNRRLAGKVCGILGFGGIGEALARLMRAMGMRIHGINRRGRSDEPTDWSAPWRTWTRC